MDTMRISQKRPSAPASLARAMPAAQCDRRFLVGPDRQGHWLAVERHGLAGGIFRTLEAALRYATNETDRRPGAVRLTRRAIAFPL